MARFWAAGVACREETWGCPHAVQSLGQLTPKLPSCWTKLSLTSNAGGASVITYLRKGKKCCTAAVRREWGKRETPLRSAKGGGGRWGSAPGATEDSAAACGQDRGEAGRSPAAPGGLSTVEQMPPPARGGPHTRAGGGAAALGEPTLLRCSGEEVENLGVKGWSWAWEEGRVVGLVFVFVSPYPILFLIGNEVIPLSQACFARDSNWRTIFISAN